MIPPGMPIVTAAEMRDAEEEAFRTVSQAELMERAGAAVAREALRFALGRPVLVVAGPGNNGGDGYVVARLLKMAGLDVAVAALGEPGAGAAALMFGKWNGPTTSLYEARARPFLIDAMFGTGLSRPLERGPRALLADLAARAEFTLAIDLPSGLDTDSGADFGAVCADATVALGALKPAHLLDAGLEKCGRVLLADIGVPVETPWRTLARPRIEPPAPRAHKYSRGLVAVIEGAMPGAARLSARAAMAGGAGYVVLAGMDPMGGEPDALVRRRIADADALAEFLDDERIGAVVVGPGLGRDRRAEHLLRTVLAAPHPAVIDGDALTLLGRQASRWLHERPAATWLTPHSGEFDRMFELTGSKIGQTLAAAAESGATVIHKGGDTVIASPRGELRVVAGASSWLSTAGTGDVLAGLVAAQVAGGQGGIAAAEAGVWLHARAAQLAGPAFIADALIAHLPEAIAECL